MLNIISRSIVSTHSRGPRKVVANLIKGLDDIGYPYVINAALDATDTLWIHDDKAALEAALKLSGNPAIITGPNIYTLPTEVPKTALNKNILFVHPAKWVEEFWNTFSTTKINSVVWPVGIDTVTFAPTTGIFKDLVLVYNKQRSQEDVDAVCTALKDQGERFAVLTYGSYKELAYQELLKRAKAVVWVGRSESQGIGLLEALSMNVPVLVWDITKLGDFVGATESSFTSEQLKYTPVTAAPYFDKACGMQFAARTELETTLNTFLSSLSTFSPRGYIEDELSLAKQAEAFVELFTTHFNKSTKELRNSTTLSTKKWRNGTLYFRCLTRMKDAVRQIIR